MGLDSGGFTRRHEEVAPERSVLRGEAAGLVRTKAQRHKEAALHLRASLLGTQHGPPNLNFRLSVFDN